MRSFIVSRLHENIPHAKSGPISFDEAREAGVISLETGVHGEHSFDVIKASLEIGGPTGSRDNRAMVFAFQLAERPNSFLEPWDKLGIERAQTDE